MVLTLHIGRSGVGVGVIVPTEWSSPTEHMASHACSQAGCCATGLASHTTVQASMHGDGVGAAVGAEVGLVVGAVLGAAVGAAVLATGATVPVV